MATARWMSGHWCTPLKGAHGRGAGLVVAAVDLSDGTDRAGLGGKGSQGNGRLGARVTRTRNRPGLRSLSSTDGGAGLGNAGYGGGWSSGQRAGSGGNVNRNEAALPFL